MDWLLRSVHLEGDHFAYKCFNALATVHLAYIFSRVATWPLVPLVDHYTTNRDCRWKISMMIGAAASLYYTFASFAWSARDWVPGLNHVWPRGLVLVLTAAAEYWLHQRYQGTSTALEYWVWSRFIPPLTETAIAGANRRMYAKQLQRRVKEYRAEHPVSPEKEEEEKSKREFLKEWSTSFCDTIIDGNLRNRYFWDDENAAPLDDGSLRSNVALHSLSGYTKVSEDFMQSVVWHLDPKTGNRHIENGFLNKSQRPDITGNIDDLFLFTAQVTEAEQIWPGFLWIQEALERVSCYETSFAATNPSHRQFEHAVIVKCHLKKYPPEFIRGDPVALDVDDPYHKWDPNDQKAEEKYVQKDRHLVSMLTIAVDRYVAVTFHLTHLLDNPVPEVSGFGKTSQTMGTIGWLEGLFMETIFNPKIIKVWFNTADEIPALEATIEHMYRRKRRGAFKEMGFESEDIKREPTYKKIGPPGFYENIKESQIGFSRPKDLHFEYGRRPCPLGFHSKEMDYAGRACPCKLANIDIFSLITYILRQYGFDSGRIYTEPEVPTRRDPPRVSGRDLSRTRKDRYGSRRDWWKQKADEHEFDRLVKCMLAGDYFVPLLSRLKPLSTMEREDFFAKLAAFPDPTGETTRLHLESHDKIEHIKNKMLSPLTDWRKDTAHWFRQDFLIEAAVKEAIGLSMVTRHLMTLESDRLLSERLTFYGMADVGYPDVHIACFDAVLHRPMRQPKVRIYEKNYWGLPVRHDAFGPPEDEFDKLYYDYKVDTWRRDHCTSATTLSKELDHIVRSCCWGGPFQQNWPKKQPTVLARHIITKLFINALPRLFFRPPATFNAWYFRFLFSYYLPEAQNFDIKVAGVENYDDWSAFYGAECAKLDGLKELSETKDAENHLSILRKETITEYTNVMGERPMLRQNLMMLAEELIIHYFVQLISTFEAIDQRRMQGLHIFENAAEYRRLTGTSAWVHPAGGTMPFWRIDEDDEASDFFLYSPPYWLRRLQISLGKALANNKPFEEIVTAEPEEQRESRRRAETGLVNSREILAACVAEVERFCRLDMEQKNLDKVIADVLASARRRYWVKYQVSHLTKRLPHVPTRCWYYVYSIIALYFLALLYHCPMPYLPAFWFVVLVVISCVQTLLGRVFVEDIASRACRPQGKYETWSAQFTPEHTRKSLGLVLKPKAKEEEEEEKLEKVKVEYEIAQARDWKPPLWAVQFGGDFGHKKPLHAHTLPGGQTSAGGRVPRISALPSATRPYDERVITAFVYLLVENPAFLPEPLMQWNSPLAWQTVELMDGACTEFELPKVRGGDTIDQGIHTAQQMESIVVLQGQSLKRTRKFAGRRLKHVLKNKELLQRYDPFTADGDYGVNRRLEDDCRRYEVNRDNYWRPEHAVELRSRVLARRAARKARADAKAKAAAEAAKQKAIIQPLKF